MDLSLNYLIRPRNRGDGPIPTSWGRLAHFASLGTVFARTKCGHPTLVRGTGGSRRFHPPLTACGAARGKLSPRAATRSNLSRLRPGGIRVKWSDPGGGPGSLRARMLMRRGGHASPLAPLRYQHATDDSDAVFADALGALSADDVARLRRTKDGRSSEPSSSAGSEETDAEQVQPEQPQRYVPVSSPTEQPQRDSNPCRHLERLAWGVQKVRSRSILPRDRPACVQGFYGGLANRTEWLGKRMGSRIAGSAEFQGRSSGESANVTLRGRPSGFSIGKPSEA
jgi:hypothetical protein